MFLVYRHLKKFTTKTITGASKVPEFIFHVNFVLTFGFVYLPLIIHNSQDGVTVLANSPEKGELLKGHSKMY